MTSNINVEDGLVNGVMGTLIRIIEGNKPLGQPQAVYVRFDNDRVCFNARAVSRPPVEIDKFAVLVQAHTEPITYKGRKYTHHQLPLRMLWGVTVQGMTHAVVSL